MVHAFLSVLVDLYQFVFGIKNRKALPPGPDQSNFVAESNRLGSSVYNATSQRLAYVRKTTAHLFVNPIPAPDAHIKTLAYGDVITVNRLEDEMVLVSAEGKDGWMRTVDLTDDKNAILPNFRSAFVYHAQDIETQKLRQFIRDEVLGGLLTLPIQPLEIVIYYLKLRSIYLPWPETKPRHPGQLAGLLRGLPGVSQQIYPKPNSIIEYIDHTGKGVIGFITTVSPKNVIVMHSAGRVDEGEYRKETFTKDQWKEWRPVFISVQ